MITLEIQLQTVFYLGFSKQNITFIEISVSRKKIRLAYRHQANSETAAECYGLVQARPIEEQDHCLSFSEEAEEKLHVVCLDVFFFYLCILQYFQGTKIYHSASLSCCFDGQAQLLLLSACIHGANKCMVAYSCMGMFYPYRASLLANSCPVFVFSRTRNTVSN